MRTIYKPAFISATLLCAYAPSAFAICPVAAPCAKISALQDVDLGTWSGVGDAQSSYNFCAYVTDDDENEYSISAHGNGVSEAFTLSSGTDTLPFELEYTEISPVSWTNLDENISETFSDPNTVQEDCSSAPLSTASMRVTIAETDMQSATSGSYSGYVIITMSPD